MQRSSALIRNVATRGLKWNNMMARSSSLEFKTQVATAKESYEAINGILASAPKAEPVLDLSKYKNSAAAADIASFFEAQVKNLEIQTGGATAEQIGVLRSGLETLKAAEAAHQARVQAAIEETEKEITLLESKKSNRDTTIDDVVALNPEFEKQVEDKLKSYEWSP